MKTSRLPCRSRHIPTSLLTEPERHPLLPENFVATLGFTVVVAPHPDDESLGCGGLLALFAKHNLPAHLIVITDGSRSHPHSRSHPPERLAAVRQEETLDALSALNIPAHSAHFLQHGDCALPSEGSPDFDAAAAKIRGILEVLRPDTLLVPWRRDPHCDHVATWQLLRAALRALAYAPRWIEYPVWAWNFAESDVAPQEAEGSAWRLEISSVLDRKTQAIAAHRSQHGKLIHDDPSGFVLEPPMLAHFAKPWELFIEPGDV